MCASIDGSWQHLSSVCSDGVTDSVFDFHVFDVPPHGQGDYFALRITPYGTFVESDDKWYVDDVTIEPTPAAGDLDRDQAATWADMGILLDCLPGPDVVACPGGCAPTDFRDADLDGDHDVDLADANAIQRLVHAAGC